MLNKNEYLTNLYAAVRVEVKILTFTYRKNNSDYPQYSIFEPSQQQSAKRFNGHCNERHRIGELIVC